MFGILKMVIQEAMPSTSMTISGSVDIFTGIKPNGLWAQNLVYYPPTNRSANIDLISDEHMQHGSGVHPLFVKERRLPFGAICHPLPWDVFVRVYSWLLQPSLPLPPNTLQAMSEKV